MEPKTKSPSTHTGILLIIIVSSICLMISCTNHQDTKSPEAISSVKDSVRILTNAIAKTITSKGPIVWLQYFENIPDFFMASEGKLVFPNYDSASYFIQNVLTKNFRSIDLQWHNMRIDSLSPQLAAIGADFHEDIILYSGKTLSENGYFTAIAKQTAQGWKLHNAHWSITPSK